MHTLTDITALCYFCLALIVVPRILGELRGNIHMGLSTVFHEADTQEAQISAILCSRLTGVAKVNDIFF